ncbi:MAG: rhodanese-like domain-containing protein [Rhodoferax sp.]|uniref:rhodanese-like domain-containing protein n=1 Tax=Rhodoferax sp. TaxID=50421 RepID=UPI003BB7AF30
MSSFTVKHHTVSRQGTRRSLLLFGLNLGLTLAACSPQAAASDSVTLDFARAEHEAGRVILIDLREPNEHATGVAKGAQLLPMRQLGARLSEIPTASDKPVLLICNTQNRSSSTLAALRERGYAHVRYVQGGMSEWTRRGWPLVRP